MITDRVAATIEVGVTPEVAFEVFTAEVGAWYVVDRDTVADPLQTRTILFEPYVCGRLLDV